MGKTNVRVYQTGNCGFAQTGKCGFAQPAGGGSNARAAWDDADMAQARADRITGAGRLHGHDGRRNLE